MPAAWPAVPRRLKRCCSRAGLRASKGHGRARGPPRAVRGKPSIAFFHVGPFSAWAAPKTPRGFRGCRSPHPAAAASFHSLRRCGSLVARDDSLSSAGVFCGGVAWERRCDGRRPRHPQSAPRRAGCSARSHGDRVLGMEEHLVVFLDREVFIPLHLQAHLDDPSGDGGNSALSGSTIPPRVVVRPSSLRIRTRIPRGSTNSLSFTHLLHGVPSSALNPDQHGHGCRGAGLRAVSPCKPRSSQHHHASDGEGDRVGRAASPGEPRPGKMEDREVEQKEGEGGEQQGGRQQPSAGPRRAAVAA